MDELGFAFENFDAVGRWRDRDGQTADRRLRPIARGPEIRRAARSWSACSSQRKQDFARTLTRRMLTYALGRGLQYYDRCPVEQIVQRLEQEEYRFSALVTGIVTSEPFRMRRGEGGPE